MHRLPSPDYHTNDTYQSITQSYNWFSRRFACIRPKGEIVVVGNIAVFVGIGELRFLLCLIALAVVLVVEEFLDKNTVFHQVVSIGVIGVHPGSPFRVEILARKFKKIVAATRGRG
jgi:hypothetical protein